MPPKYDLDKIKFATDEPTFEKAVSLYEAGKVTKFREGIGAYSAVVLGTKPYRVSVEARQYGLANCDCYLGENDTLCKHMVAVAIYAVKGGGKLSKEEKELVSSPKCNGKLGELSKEELAQARESISLAIKYIKPYNGLSRNWFTYQNSLDEGVARLSKLVSELPVSEQTAKVLIDLLLRLDKKLCVGGVDDSNGTVGGFVYEVVGILEEFVKLDQKCIKAFEKLCGKETCFGWEEPLLQLIKK
ncbi:MAG: SWIM zinc finger family protein [bacterium]